MKKTETTTEKPNATFTKFARGENWVKGTVGQYNFEAKLFDEGSAFGIKKGRVSKLAIWDDKVRFAKQDFFAACVVNYDRGWDIKPSKENEPFFNSVMELLENAPKLF